MRRKIFTYAIITFFSIMALGCEKVSSDGKVELYLLDSYKTVREHSCQIDETTVKTKANPLISYDDFISYDPLTHEFLLSDRTVKVINNTEQSVHGIAFAIKANGEIIYTGYFWPSYSSATCDWVYIDPIMTSFDNKMEVCLGYPGPMPGQEIPDKRNDSRIIKIFKRDHKLVE
ncbi:MAG: hypothetical protein GX798_03575 [Bacteroidales bacterium]|jgi:hypothetical protein|nr:hypothetical protein [Bacteroidales bacterium]